MITLQFLRGGKVAGTPHSSAPSPKGKKKKNKMCVIFS